MSSIDPSMFVQNLSPLESIQQDIDMFGRGIRPNTEQEGIDFRKKIKEQISGLSESDRNSFYDKNPGYNPEFKVFDPRGTGGALEGSPRGPQQQNPYDSLKKLFGGNLQRSGGNLQDLFGRIGQQTGQMRDQGPPNIYETNQGPQHRMRMEAGSQYEGRNSDGSIFRSQFPMGNNPPRPRVMTQGPESMLRVQTGINKLGMRGNNPPRMPSRPDIRQRSEFYQPQGPQQPLRQEAGHDALNRRIQQQMQQRGEGGRIQNHRARMPQRMPQPNQGYGNRFPGMQFSGPFSQPMMPQNYGMGGGYRQPPMMPQYPQPRMPYPQPMPQPGYGGGYGGGFGGRGPGGGYGNMYAQQPQMYGGGYPPQPPMFGGGYGGGYGQQPQYGGGFGGGMQGGYGGGMGGMYNQPQRQPQYQNASPFGGQMNQRQQPQQMAQQMGGFGGGIMRSFY